MKTWCVVLGACAVFAIGCGKTDKDKGKAKAGDNMSSARISRMTLDSAKKLFKGKPALEALMPKLEKLLGKPTSKSANQIIWAGVTGDDCMSLKLSLADGKYAGWSTSSANKIVTDKFEACKKLTKK